MAVLFGNRDDFAIEAGTEPNLMPPSAVWGHMCVWCRDVSLGDLDEPQCALYGAYCGFGSLLAPIHDEPHVDRLWADELVGLSDMEAWNFFDLLLYGYRDDVEVSDIRTLDELQRDWTMWGAFDFLTNWGESFDNVKTFIMRPPGELVRILSDQLPKEMGRAVEVSRDGFVSACEGFLKWYEEQEKRLQLS